MRCYHGPDVLHAPAGLLHPHGQTLTLITGAVQVLQCTCVTAYMESNLFLLFSVSFVKVPRTSRTLRLFVFSRMKLLNVHHVPSETVKACFPRVVWKTVSASLMPNT